MDEPQELARKMVDLTRAQAEMAVYKHLNDYMKKYALKLKRELNEVKQKLEKQEKKGARNSDYGNLFVRSNLLQWQICQAEKLELEFLKRAMEVCDKCDDPLKEAKDLYERFTSV